MAKKKKAGIDPKILRAQYRNQYLRELKRLYNQIHPDLFSRISNRHLEKIFLSRGRTAKLVIEGWILPEWFTKYCQDNIREHMVNNQIEIVPGGLTVNLHQFSNYIIPLMAWAKELAPLFANDPWFEEIILNNFEKFMNQYEHLMNVISLVLMYMLTQPPYQFCNLEYIIENGYSPDGSPRIEQKYKLRLARSAKARIIYNNGEKRTAYEVLQNFHKAYNPHKIAPFTPLTFLPSHFGVKTEEPEEKPYPVFILQHALDRLDERLDCPVFGYTTSLIVDSLQSGKVYKLSAHKLLVEYHIEEAKAGYLQVDVREDVILIRTFLFLTNETTPEGQKLRTHLGLHTEDIKFLNIDKLTPFLETDILKDEKICTLLRDSGCESLIHLCETVKNSSFWQLPEETKEMAEKLKRYMMEGEK